MGCKPTSILLQDHTHLNTQGRGRFCEDVPRRDQKIENLREVRDCIKVHGMHDQRQV